MIKLIILTFLIFSLFSCKYSDDLDKLKSLSIIKEQIVELGQFELTQENQELLANYFLIVKDLSYNFKNNSKMQKYVHRKFNKYFNSSLCKAIVIDKKLYDLIIKKCSINNFFICSEDIKYFNKILMQVAKDLTDKEIERLRSDSMCNTLFEEYALKTDL